MSAPALYKHWEGQTRLNIVINITFPAFIAFVLGFMMFVAGLASPFSVWLVLIGLAMAIIGGYSLWASYILITDSKKS